MLDDKKLYIVSSDYDGWEYAIATSEKVIKRGDTLHDPYYEEYAFAFAYGRKLELVNVNVSDTKDLEDNREVLKHVGLYDEYKSRFEDMYG